MCLSDRDSCAHQAVVHAVRTGVALPISPHIVVIVSAGEASGTIQAGRTVGHRGWTAHTSVHRKANCIVDAWGAFGSTVTTSLAGGTVVELGGAQVAGIVPPIEVVSVIHTRIAIVWIPRSACEAGVRATCEETRWWDSMWFFLALVIWNRGGILCCLRVVKVVTVLVVGCASDLHCTDQ